MEGDGIEVVYKEYKYERNGKEVIIKRRWTKQIKEPKRVKDIRDWINKHYDKTKSVNVNYIQYLKDFGEDNTNKPTTITTFNKYYKQEKNKPKEIQQPLKLSAHSTDSSDSEPSTKSEPTHL